jgi:hypothetical protein
MEEWAEEETYGRIKRRKERSVTKQIQFGPAERPTTK